MWILFYVTISLLLHVWYAIKHLFFFSFELYYTIDSIIYKRNKKAYFCFYVQSIWVCCYFLSDILYLSFVTIIQEIMYLRRVQFYSKYKFTKNGIGDGKNRNGNNSKRMLRRIYFWKDILLSIYNQKCMKNYKRIF